MNVCLFFVCFYLFFLYCFRFQQHSHGSTNSTFRKIDLLYSAFSFCIVIQFSIEWFTAFYWCSEHLKAGFLESANLKTLFKDRKTYQIIHNIWSIQWKASPWLFWTHTASKMGWKGCFAWSIGLQTPSRERFSRESFWVLTVPQCAYINVAFS